MPRTRAPEPDLNDYVLVRKDELRALVAEVAMTARLATLAVQAAEQRLLGPLAPYAKASRLLLEALHPEIAARQPEGDER